jgi:hypothetical protein
MSETSQKNILLLGLPENGKTSFLAALYYTASSEIPNKSIKEYQMSAESTYLNMIRKQWLGCEKVDRTINVTSTSTKDVMLHLESLKFNQRFDLHIPDVAGESFITQFVDRLWEKSYEQQVNTAGGILLFVHPARLRPHVLIDDTQFAAAALTGFNEENDQPGNVKIEDHERENVAHHNPLIKETVEFKAEECPTQIILSDILQNHLEQNHSNSLNIAIVISAWETVLENENHTPEKWLELNLPLLYQYLSCNFEQISYKVFGVSAQGGDIGNQVDVDRLQNCDDPTDRIIVQTADQKSKDIGIPIEWIIEQWLK